MKLTKSPGTTPAFRNELDRIFDRMFAPWGLEVPEMKVFETAWAPSVDLAENDKEFVVRLEAPGVNKENMDVSLDGNVLTISGRREFRKDIEREEYIWREREEGNFVRLLRMPKAVQEGKVTATYDDGVLTVRLLKTEPTVKTKIAIK